MAVLSQTIDLALEHYATMTANAFKADVFAYFGDINQNFLIEYRTQIESLATRDDRTKNLAFIIYTGGGVAEMVEKMVEIARHHYEEIWFVVPDMAMSAGTILCMSGDKIYMDYSSALGPIDPQIPNSDNQLVPALGYLDQVERLIEKSRDNTITNAEFAMLQNQDLATLRRYEQAKDLSISLLKAWLVKYKFKDWNKHSSTGEKVTYEEKEKRAVEIAEALSDHKKWHSHGRMIGIDTLVNELKLKIEDYTNMDVLKSAIRQYSDLLLDCAANREINHIFHFGRYEKQGVNNENDNRET